MTDAAASEEAMGTFYVDLDVHKVSISVSVAEDSRGGDVRFLGEIPNTPTDIASWPSVWPRMGPDWSSATRRAAAATASIAKATR